MANQKIVITIWNEFRHERNNGQVKSIYPEGIHTVIADSLRKRLEQTYRVGTAVLDEPEHGLSEAVLADTDVLTWWGHGAHAEVRDDIVERVQQRVWEGMGLVVLHSGHHSKIFTRLMGTGCGLKWREAAEREIIWNVSPGHPITDGLADHFELPQTEMYGELFDIPQPDELVFLSWFEGGEVFRSGCCFRRGKGRIFYFRPGHETYPIFHDENVQRVIANAVRWAVSTSDSPYAPGGHNVRESLASRSGQANR